MAAKVGTKLKHYDLGKLVAIALPADVPHTCSGCAFFDDDVGPCPATSPTEAMWCGGIIWVKDTSNKKKVI